MKNRIAPEILMLLAILIFGSFGINNCFSTENTDGDKNSVVSAEVKETGDDAPDISLDTGSTGYFSERDFEVGYDENESAVIYLNGDMAECSSDAVQISGSTVTIGDEGTYIFSGTLDDGMIIVNTEKTDKVQMVLNGVSIHSETSAPIYILQSDKVFITTASDSTNTLSNGGTFTAIDENNIDSVIFSKEDVTLNGSGTLVVTSPGGHGIVSKDSLTITSGKYDISCSSHGLTGKDDVCIANGAVTIVSGKDGIHAENEDDTASGFVYIQSGTFDIAAEGDGISASASVTIEDGSFNIVSGGGSANAASQVSDAWGSFRGGGKHHPGGFDMKNNMDSTTDTSEDSTSIKGIKAASDLIINGGTFTIDSADDSVHSNASATVNGGIFDIASGDDAFHADEKLTVTEGNIKVTESYEGLEGLHVCVSGGDITLAASDDGLNAAGGTDSSGMTGGRDGRFGGSMTASGGGSIVISGGMLDVTASGDGIDANGTIEITGGYTTVCGPVQGDTATLDYDMSAVISGGTFIGTGASGMAQTFSSSEQGVIAVNAGNQSAGTQITLADSEGNTVLTHTPDTAFAVVILSCPDITKGELYTLTVGDVSEEFTAS